VRRFIWCRNGLGLAQSIPVAGTLRLLSKIGYLKRCLHSEANVMQTAGSAGESIARRCGDHDPGSTLRDHAYHACCGNGGSPDDAWPPMVILDLRLCRKYRKPELRKNHAMHRPRRTLEGDDGSSPRGKHHFDRDSIGFVFNGPRTFWKGSPGIDLPKVDLTAVRSPDAGQRCACVGYTTGPKTLDLAMGGGAVVPLS